MPETMDYSTDFCVVGGGLAGICASVAAARRGIKVVLMHERPMLGGNASSEIRMWVCGAQGRNVTETGLLEELFMENLWMNPYKLYPMFDALLYQFVKREPNITLLLNCSCFDAQMKDKETIESVTGWQMTTQRFIRVRANYFADCSGDSILAPLTGAHFRVGREAASEFGERINVPVADQKTMGNSCLIQAHLGKEKVTFTPPPFAKKLHAEDLRYRRPDLNSDSENFWYLELGGDRDTVADAEQIRDELVALAYGMWDYIKNSGEFKNAEYWQLDFIGFLPGKRESRRMLGKVIVTQNDILSDRNWPDAAAYGGWPLDDHDPAGFRYDGHPNTAYDTPAPYAIPYRALYSVNIRNLFFAGRNISMTHAAMSSSRVMATCALCGQAVGTAAAIAAAHGVLPHDVYETYLAALQDALLWDDCMLPHHPRTPSEVMTQAELTLDGAYTAALENLRDGNDRENVFICEAGQQILCRFRTPRQITEVRIVFDSDLDRQTLPGSQTERRHMTRCNLLPDSPVMHLPSTLCSDFILEGLDETGSPVITKKTTNNLHRLVKLPLHGRKLSALRLTPLAAHAGGTQMRLFSLDVQ